MPLDTNRFLARYLDQSAAVHLFDASADGTIVSCNAAVVRVMRLPRAHIVDCPVWGFLAEGHEKVLRDRVSKPDNNGGFRLTFLDSRHVPYVLECRVHVRSGGFLLLGEAPVADSSGEEQAPPDGGLAALTPENPDRTGELEHAVRELREAHAMLVHSQKMAALGQMTAKVVHEINNPLGFVLNNHEMLRQDFDDLLGFLDTVSESIPALLPGCPEAHAKLTEKTSQIDVPYLISSVPRKLAANLEGLERVRRIVVDLRNFSRLEAPDFKLCDLEENMRSTLLFLGPMMRSHQVEVETEFEPVGEVYCSPGALNQAVSNVVINAIQASTPGTKVRLTTSRKGPNYVIAVEDKGTGIVPEIRQRIFDPFFTTKPVGTGTGLGLNITQQVITDHGGRIEFDSKPGSGTTVRMYIPASKPPDRIP